MKPLNPATQSTPPAHPAAARPLLVVDDDETNRDLLSRRLMRAGYPVEVAASAQDALELMKSCEVDLVLLDSMMPGMSGVDLLRLLRATHGPEALPVIMVTALAESNKVVEALNLGANDYITKPIDFAVALARIQSQLLRKKAEDALRESEQRYSLAARGANDGLWDWDLTSNVVHYSARWREMLGLETLAGTSPSEWLDRVHEEDRAALRSELEALWANPKASDLAVEHRLQHATGSWRWMLARGHVLRSADGAAVRMAGSLTDVTENKSFDSLTGLANRVLLIERVERALHTIREDSARSFAVLFLDLDRFKVVNDSLGHAAGDQLIVSVAARLRSILGESQARGSHLLARLGGDEFAVLLENMDAAEARALSAKIQKAMQRPFYVDGREVFESISIGIVAGAPGYRDAQEVLRDADTAMYHAKSLGRARCEVFSSDLRRAAVSRMEIENDLRRAIECSQFVLHYQPKIALESEQLTGFEALIRWRHPARGLVSPGEFIPVADETGLILPIGLWVLRESCMQMKQWQLAYPGIMPIEMSVNLSPSQFRHPDLTGQIAKILEETGLDPLSLQLEVTEGVLIENPENAIEVLRELRKLGLAVKLDDFGTGYSSLSYLQQLPCDSLKIDRSFVTRICEDESSFQIVKTIVTLARALGMGVTAEGVETEGQVSRLVEIGCGFGQGYLFSAPLPEEEARKFIDRSLRTAAGKPVILAP